MEQQELSFLMVMQNGIITLDDSIAGLPRWCWGKESACQCRRHKRHRLDPWLGKIPWSRKWHCTPIFLPGKCHGLMGYSPWGHKESDTTEQLSMHTDSFLTKLNLLSRNHTPWYKLRGLKNLHSHKNLNMDLYSGFIYKYHNLEAASKSSSRWMDE